MIGSKYKKAAIITFVTLVVLVTSITVAASLNSKRSAQKEIQEAEKVLQGKTDPVEEGRSAYEDGQLHEENETEHQYHDHEGAAAIMVGDIEIASDEEIDRYTDQATGAAIAYISQHTNETNEQRQSRLTGVFSSSSPVINRAAPSVDPTYTKPSTSSATVLYYDWRTTSQELVVFVALKVSTRNSSGQVVSDIHQGYDVGLRYVDGSFQPYSIEFNDRPIVVR